MNLDTRYHIAAEKKKDFVRKRDLDPDEESTYGYKPREELKRGIDAQEDAFTSVMSRGINVNESIFDRTAVFHTR